jgi:choline monooxygenase
LKSLKELLTKEERDAIRAPITTARTLPRRCFIDADFYAFEVRHALAESWLAVAFRTSIPEPGDIAPITALGYPLLLVRDGEGRARVFHNVCPYDGCEVATSAKRALKTITGPYHGWKYGLDGKLLEANYWDGTPAATDVDLESLNADLIAVPCEEWMSTLFVYLGSTPVTFEEQYAPVLKHLELVDLERLEIGLGEDDRPQVNSLTIASNWKTVYENYAPNVYHEAFVHEMYRKSPHSPRVDENRNKTYTEINDPSGYLGLCYDNAIGASLYGETSLPRVLNKDGTPNRVNTISNVYPNWVTTVLGDAARIAFFLPEGPETGTQWVATFFDRDGASDPALLDDRKQSAKAGIKARVEDNRICESIQRARHSPGVESQFYNPFWDAMHYTMTNLILDKLERSEG